MSNAISGVGTSFSILIDEAWIEIAEINAITGPSKSRDTIDATSLNSTGGYREFIGGFRKGGTVVLKMNFTREAYDLMNMLFENEIPYSCKIGLPDDVGTTVVFSGLVTEIPLTIPTDDKITLDVTTMISGEPIISNAFDYVQYLLYSDGNSIIRKGVREGNFIVDIALTPTGFSGIENVDWENIEMVN